MKLGILDATVLVIAICLAVIAQEKSGAQIEQLPTANSENTIISIDRQPHISGIQTKTQSQPVQSVHGVIEGSLGYPGEFIPPLKICAENLTTQTQLCTSVHLKDTKYQYGVGYRLEVPSGTYHVFADYREKKAYFSRAVQCGLTVGCDDHEPVTVTVQASKIITRVDPIDWCSPSAYGCLIKKMTKI